MPGIPPELHTRLRNALLECEQFASNDALQSVVSPYPPLKPWRFNLPQTNSIPSRVDAVIGYLVGKRRSDTQENALVLLLHLLSTLIDKEDERHHQLLNLAAELQDAFENNSTTNKSKPTTEPKINPRGNAVKTNDEPQERRPIKNRWALLVGVNSYNDPNFGRLNFCVDDVLALEERLKTLKYGVVCLHDGLEYDNPRFPTHENVEAELIRLCQMVEPDDLLLVHFACHGTLFNGQPVLLVNNTRSQTWQKTGLTLEFVKQHMRSSKARRLVLTLDACHMGVETGRDIDDPQFIHNAYELAEGFALIAASTAQQKAQEWQGQKHGVFTYYLLEALNGKADRGSKRFVTVDDIKTY
ncbi:MAG: caspase family protein [Rhizonema sp. PD38]|nr:caspase family protein [Rhizonema sp. PD38]